MQLSTIFRWIGPAAIAYGLFLVVSDMSGMPLPLPGLEHVVPTGSSAVGSGLILWALVFLLVGMVGLYARLPQSDVVRAAAEREALYRDWELDYEQPLDDKLAVLCGPDSEETRYGTTRREEPAPTTDERTTFLSTPV